MASSRFGFTGIIGGVSAVVLLLTSLIYQSNAVTGHQYQEEAQTTSNRATAQVNEQTTKAVDDKELPDTAPRTVEEARIRAQILHDAFAGALRVMHRDYFREDQRLTLPSKSLEDVFEELAETHQVKLRWLAVNANAMNVDHKPQNEFEGQVVKALSSGKSEFESANEESFQYAGSIPLSASCVKCHVRSRTSNAEKKAALVITMPLRNKK